MLEEIAALVHFFVVEQESIGVVAVGDAPVRHATQPKSFAAGRVIRGCTTHHFFVAAVYPELSASKEPHPERKRIVYRAWCTCIYI